MSIPQGGSVKYLYLQSCIPSSYQYGIYNLIISTNTNIIETETAQDGPSLPLGEISVNQGGIHVIQ